MHAHGTIKEENGKKVKEKKEVKNFHEKKTLFIFDFCSIFDRRGGKELVFRVGKKFGLEEADFELKRSTLGTKRNLDAFTQFKFRMSMKNGAALTHH